MKIKLTALLLFIPVFAAGQTGQGQAQLCYEVGDTIASDVFLYDAAGERKPLLDLAGSESKVIYLLLFGGPTLNASESYGGLWCVDSFNDMPVSNYLYLKYRNRGVAFVAVACPPIYGEEEYGFAPEVFLPQPDTSAIWRGEFQNFVQACYELQSNHVIPFERLYFDPKFRLMYNHKKQVAFSDPILSWMGRFKPCSDAQSYSLPAIWIFSTSGRVLHEPFAGNRYSNSTQRLQYTAREVESALLQALEHKQ